jgi:hypothetical protein
VIKWIALYAPMRWPSGIQTVPEFDQRTAGTPPLEFDADVATLETLLGRIGRATAARRGPGTRSSAGCRSAPGSAGPTCTWIITCASSARDRSAQPQPGSQGAMGREQFHDTLFEGGTSIGRRSMTWKTSRAAARSAADDGPAAWTPAQQGGGEVHPRPRQVHEPRSLAGLRDDQTLAQRHFLAEARLRLRIGAAVEVGAPSLP